MERSSVRRHRATAVALATMMAAAASCGGGGSDGAASSAASTPEAALSPSYPVTVTLLAHDAFATSKAIFDDLTKATGIKVEVANGGDAGEVLNKAILTKGKPEGDLLWGVDNTLQSRAVASGLFVPYESPARSALEPGVRQLVPGHELTPVDKGDVCLNIDKSWFTSKGIAPPRTLEDLTKPAYRGLLVVENPATSSPGLVFLLATIARFGPDGWQAYWRELKANHAQVVDSWTEAYTVQFSGSSGKGPRPIVVSYGSSPPAEVVFADPPIDAPPTAVVSDGCFRQYEEVGILAGTTHLAAAKAVVDYLLGKTFQADMPLNMFVYPVRSDVALPEVFTKFAVVPDRPVVLPPADIAAHRDAWIAEWTKLVVG